MIVKNESAVIERCLRSLRERISYWTIVDTGSADETMAKIRQAMEGVPGQLLERPWVNFGHNRTEALSAANGKSDFVLVIDADMEADFTSEGNDWLSRIEGDLIEVRYAGNLDYAQSMLVRSGLPWRYEGVTHEYITCDAPFRSGKTDGVRLVHHLDGARRPTGVLPRRSREGVPGGWRTAPSACPAALPGQRRRHAEAQRPSRSGCQ